MQRRIKRNKKLITETNHYLKQKFYHTKQYCSRNFGFVAKPNLTLQQNFKEILQTNYTPSFRQPVNLTFHNLCSTHKIPLGTKQLLGLNLKYCLATNNMNHGISDTVRKMAYSIQTSYYLKNSGSSTDQSYHKQIYAKNKLWDPPPQRHS